ncbi:hypothetical protein FKM82_015591 [Ascaphus truei]
MSKTQVVRDSNNSQPPHPHFTHQDGETMLKEDLQASRKIERFSIPLDNLKMMFEKPSRIVVVPRRSSKKKEAEIERSLRSPTFKKQPGSHSSISTKDSGTKGGKTFSNKMSEHGQNSTSEGFSKSKKGPLEEDTPWRGSVPLDLQESVSLRDRMAMYQAAVSNKSHSSTANALEQSETCTVPGGLATMKKHFEKSDIATSHSAVTQYQYQHKSVKETIRSNEVTITNSTQATEHKASEAETQFSASEKEQVSVHEQSTHETSTASNYNQEVDGVAYGETPKISTQVLKEQFERSLKEKGINSSGNSISQGKQAKIYNEYPEFEWPAVTTNLTGSASRTYDALTTMTSEHAATSVHTSSDHFGSLEEFPPPPPPNILQKSEMQEFSQSPEPRSSAENHALTSSKDLYSKQRNLYELNRLYKHIHPEVRKNLEKEYFSEVSDIVSSQCDQRGVISGDVQQAKYVFENSGDSPQKCISPEREYLEWDEILKGEVQSMRWVFENQPLDSIKDESLEQSHIKSIGEQEIIAGGDVKYTTWMFETQPIHVLGTDTSNSSENVDKVPDLARGDVRTAAWLFETQPLDSLNKMYTEKDPTEVTGAEDIKGGDVKTGRYLFETRFHDEQLYSLDEMNMLRLRSELQEIKGDVKRTVKQFETEPKYVFKDGSGQVLEIKSVCREDIERGDVKAARWMFETQPLDMINQDDAELKVVRGIAMEESVKGGVGKAKWLFETHPLDTIKEQDGSVTEKETIIGADVYKKCWLFETLPMDILKDNTNDKPQPGEEILGGNVTNTKHLFETMSMDEFKENVEVGRLKQVVTTEDEKGDVRHQRWVFETKPLEQIREEKRECVRTVQLDEIHKGDVSSCKNVFETADWKKCDLSHKIQVEDVNMGAVKLNKKLFETTPLYAIQDRLGHYHEVQTIRQEEIVRGDVRTCQWRFETTPIDQFGESGQNYQIIKGISSQEIQSGDVKTGKWLFETQSLDSIKHFSNMEDEEVIKEHTSDIVKGDVKKCKWLFETQPMEALYDKQDTIINSEEIQKGDVKTCTWLFETQPLDSIQDESEKTIGLHTIDQEKIQGKDVQTACFLFETQNLENIQGEENNDFKRVVEIDVQSGDVSTMKYIFENQSLDKISSSSEEVLQKIKTMKCEDLQNGNVLNCRWLFENHSIDEINENQDKNKSACTVTDVQGGNVRKGCFIFETFSLDQIKDENSEASFIRTVGEDQIIKGDVKNYTMMFETQPLYAIQDKEGFYHEVTTVKKEEVSHGNVRGTRWLFETKPLDSINDSNEVFIIKAVTQEDIQKGNVSSVRWRFETQSLDNISDDVKAAVRTIDNIQGGNVKANKQLFENEDDKSQFVRTVSISEIKHGNVKTSTWLFETHTIDEIHGEDYENIKTVTMEDVQEGDVQQAVWLFEKHSLDSIRELDESVEKISKEEIPQADVRTTTWLFETTPLHEFNEHKIERKEITGKSIQETLKELYCHKIVESHGIIIEADEIGDVRMAKYQLMNQETPEIQKEEVIRGDLQDIMMNLLSQNSSTERMVLINDEEKGNVHLTKSQLLNQSTDVQAKREDIIQGDIQEATKNLFKRQHFVKQGILIQESEKGDIKMTVYSLLNKSDNSEIQRDNVTGCDIKRTIHKLKSSARASESLEKIKIDNSERGNVQFYSTCIESGALDYLKRLQKVSDDVVFEREDEEIIGGDVEGTKLLLKKQQFHIERTVDEADIIHGDVYNTVKVFMTEPENKSFDVNKEEVVKGDLKATLNSLSQAINQTVDVEKEEIIKADLNATLKSLTDSQYQVRDTEKPDVIPGDIQGTIDCLEKAVNIKTEFAKEKVIHGNLEATLKSLEEAKQSLKEVEKESIIRGDINATVQNLQDASAEKIRVQHQVSVQGDVKSTIKTLLQPSLQTVQRRESVDGAIKNTIKSLYHEETHSENEMLAKKDVPGRKIISVGHEQLRATKMDCRNQECTSTLQQKVTESCDALLDNVALKNDEKRETNYHSGQNMNSHARIRSVDENSLKIKKTEVNKAWTKHNTFSGVQAAELDSEGKKCLLEGFSEGRKEKTPTDLINQNKVMQKAKLSCSINASKSSESQQAISVINRGSYQVSDHVHKQVANQQTQHIQHSRKMIGKNEANIQQAQVLDSINNNIEIAEKVKIAKEKSTEAKEAELKEKTHVTENKCVHVIEKSNTAASRADHQFLRKNNLYLTKVKKEREKPEINFPPPPPLPPPCSTPLPLPPAPPLPVVPQLKTNTDIEYFPSPPSPVVDKLDNEYLPPPPTPTPPPHPQYKELVNKKVSFLPQHEQLVSHSEQWQSFHNNVAVKSLGTSLSQKCTKTEQVTESSEKHGPEVPSKAKLPVFQPTIGDVTITQMNESQLFSKETTSSEYEQKLSTSQASTDEFEQLLCDRELERIHQETLTPKKKVFFSPRMSPALQSVTPPMKRKTYTRKFKTPLMIAEEKYRQQREELEKNKSNVMSLVSTTTASESKTIHITAGSEVTKPFMNESPNATKTTTHDLHHVKDPVPPANNSTISNVDFQHPFHLSKQKSTPLVTSSNASNLPKGATLLGEHQVKQEQAQTLIESKECNVHSKVEQRNEQFNKSEKSKKVEQLQQVKNRIMSPKLEVKHVHENIQNTNKSAINMKQVNSTENMRQEDNTTFLKKQRMTEECQRVHFSEKNLSQKINTESISYSSEQPKLENSGNVQTAFNEMEIKKAQSNHVGLSVMKSTAQDTLGPKVQKKEQVNKEQVKIDNSVKKRTIDIHSHLEMSQTVPECKVQRQESPLQKDTVQENKSMTQNIVRDRQMHEVHAKKETAEKKQLVSFLDSQNKEELNSMDVIECIRKCEELQQVVSKVRQFETDPRLLNISTFKIFLNSVPVWLISQDKNKGIYNLAASSNVDGITEQLSYIKHHALDMQSSFEGNIHAAIRSSTTTKSRNESNTHNSLSQKQKIVVSKKIEKTNRVLEDKTKMNNEFGRLSSDIKQLDFRACSPSLKMRSPSPTFIKIESTARRTESPQKDSPSCPSPLQREPTPVPLPPRRSATPKMTSAHHRSEQLAKLKDTTAKLSHGATQPRVVTPIPVVVEKKCEIIHSPATLRRQLKIESHAKESICTTTTAANELTANTVKDRKEMHAEARKSEVHKMHTQKDPKHIPEWLGPDMDSLDVVSVTQKIEVPKIHAYEGKDKKVYTKKESTNSHAKLLKYESKDEIHKTEGMEVTNINVKTNKGQFQAAQQKTVHQENHTSATEVPQLPPAPPDVIKEKSRSVPIKLLKDRKGDTAKQIFVNRHHEDMESVFKPVMHSEAISISEQFSGVDKLEKKMVSSRLSQNSESMKSGFDFKHAPPTYEDVISGHMLDISAAESPEELLKNFQKTWEESERVFKSLGYTVSDSSEMRSSYHQEEVVTENAASGKGNVHCLSKASLSNGMPSDRQADLS